MAGLKIRFGQGLEGVNARGGVDRVLVDGRQGLKLGGGDRVKKQGGGYNQAPWFLSAEK